MSPRVDERVPLALVTRRDSLDSSSSTSSIGRYISLGHIPRILSVCTLVRAYTNYETTNTISPISANFEPNLTWL